MTNLDIMIRGFLYKENWTPLSSRRYTHKKYTINFMKCIHTYEKLIKNLARIYNIRLIITSYSSTPVHILNDIQAQLNPNYIFLCEEKGSTQFSTVINAYNHMKDNFSDHTLIIRSDLILTDYIIDLISSSAFDSYLYILCKENNKLNRAVDILHILSKDIYKKYIDYIHHHKKNTHDIHKEIKTKLLSDQNKCKAVRDCNEFYKIWVG